MPDDCRHRTFKREFATAMMAFDLALFVVAIWQFSHGAHEAAIFTNSIAQFVFPFATGMAAAAFGADWLATQSPWREDARV